MSKNIDRAARALRAASLYTEHVEDGHVHVEAQIADLLTDLRHLCAARARDGKPGYSIFAGLNDTSRENYHADVMAGAALDAADLPRVEEVAKAPDDSEKLLRIIARMKIHGEDEEDGEDGETYFQEADDAISTLGCLIAEARKCLKKGT